MPEEVLFSGPAQVQITNYSALKPVHATAECTIYEPVGFGGDVRLVDRRRRAREVARLTVSMTETAVLSFTLSDGDQQPPAHALLLAIGPQEMHTPRAPLFMQIAPLADGQYAYLALSPLPRKQRRATAVAQTSAAQAAAQAAVQAAAAA